MKKTTSYLKNKVKRGHEKTMALNYKKKGIIFEVQSVNGEGGTKREL